MFLMRLTSQLVRAVPWAAGCNRPWLGSGVLGNHAYRPPYNLQSTSPSRAASLPGKGSQLELEEILVPRKMAVSPLESWLTARYLLPRLDAGTPVTVAPAQFYKCPPAQVEEVAKQGVDEVLDAPSMHCRNVLKIRRRKMNHHKYRKLIKRTRFLRRKVREGRLKKKQIKFERDLRRIWLKTGLKEAPQGWQTPKIYVKSK
uniref:Small ribosomal subunit protein mS38 n=1 Tax=Jaculus jaculus TaxID=51337 RepID=A0A8C5P2T4_JACJA|nr:aurora kinase A-interacting protein [Jaculus jaculus]XP_045005688.1 aurora kinase A-interacting protein [Jaculus jaculus]XP_045005689.1 aurora kinase A-interacting protein [Jaculus jaculus]XP_045005690.1 aurora kinase A-interacting protein [Jaculus jaculus]